MTISNSMRKVGAVSVTALSVGLVGYPSPAPPPNLPPPEYEAPRELQIPTAEPEDEAWPPAAAEPAPLPEEPAVEPPPPPPEDADAGVEDGGESDAAPE